MIVGKSITRVDAPDKVTGRAKFTEDLLKQGALVAKVLHSNVAHAMVRSIDVTEAEKVPGVLRVFTCFDVPDIPFARAGHPWSIEESHRDVADRHLLNRHVRYYGDDVAAVVAENEIACDRALRLIKVDYEVLPFVLDAQEAMKDGAPVIHEGFPNNVCGHSEIHLGNVAEAIKEEGLTKIEGWYETPAVQHSHIEPPISYAYEEAGKIVVVSSTQIPQITRRVCAIALGLPWGKVRIIKPYIGGGFGNKQDALYEPLNAWLCQQMGGRTVLLSISREETFTSTRVRHGIRYHLCSWVRQDGSFAARTFQCWSNQGAYGSHSHGVTAKGMGAFPQFYPCPNVDCEAWTVYTNRATSGAMRGYGIPQVTFAMESHTDDICQQMGFDPLEFRKKNTMPVGYVDAFSKNENYFDSIRQCLDKGAEAIDFKRKQKEYAEQSGDIRRGVGCAAFWYNTAVWPISLESSSCRMLVNQDGSVQMQLGETEIGQGADTAFSQMAAEAIGVPFENVHIVSAQDTDLTPYGSGSYASRQTYVAGFAIRKTADILRERILNYAHEILRFPVALLDIVDGKIIRSSDRRELMTLGELATQALYSLEHSVQFSAESTAQVKSNAYSFGCTFAEVEVDIPLCKVKVLNMINVHDCGRLINPQLAEAQVHGGMSMALGYGITEKCLFDEKTGRMLNNNLLDYKLGTSMDHPDKMQAFFVENPEPTSVFGTKSLGEPPANSGAPAIRNAVLQATGVAINQNPLNPHELFRAFSEAKLFDE